MRHMRKVYVGLAGLLTLLLMQPVPASADPSALPNDVVGVGSDTIFVALDFVADGDHLAHAGFNAGHPHRRMLSFSPTGDANGRLTPLTPAGTVRLRGGGKPVTRPNGSGPGITAMNNDLGPTHQINFVRSSRPPTSAEQATAVSRGWGGIHCYQFATDGLQMAVSRTTPPNAGTSGLSINTLVQLYSASGTVRNWGDVPGYNGPTPNTPIKPLAIQAGSGTRQFFDAQLALANGGTPITYRSDLTVVEEHDPAPIMNDPNAIAPFSTARRTLLDNGYFGTASQNVVSLLAPPANPNAFAVTRPVFVLVRQSSVTDTTGSDGIAYPWRLNNQNWVQALFAPGSFLAGPLSNQLVTAAGFTKSYVDHGICQA